MRWQHSPGSAEGVRRDAHPYSNFSIAPIDHQTDKSCHSSYRNSAPCSRVLCGNGNPRPARRKLCDASLLATAYAICPRQPLPAKLRRHCAFCRADHFPLLALLS